MQMAKFGAWIVLIAAVIMQCGLRTTKAEIDRDASSGVEEQTPVVPESSLMSGEPIQIGWIQTFQDPQLEGLVKEAQAKNKDLQSAAANVERAIALARQAGAALKPTVNLSSGGTRSGNFENSSGESSSLNLEAQVGWEIDVWGRIRAGVRSATASAQAAEADFRYAKHSLAATTAKGYFTAIEANLQVGIAKENLSILQETMRIVNVRYKNGLANAQDVALATSDLASARERLTTLEGSQRDAVRALELLLGRYPSSELVVGKTLPRLPASPPSGIPSGVLERRPDIIAAERRVAAAFNAVAQAKAARLPSLSLTGSIGGASNSLSNIVDPANLAWRVGTSLLAPLFDGGRRRTQVEIATAEQKAALAAYGQAALNAFSEVETSLDQGVVLASRERDLKEVVREAEKAYRIVNLRYREGESDLLDVLTIQARVIGAKSNLSSIQRLLLQQRINLHLGLGGSWN